MDIEQIRAKRAEYYQKNKEHLSALNRANRKKWWSSLTEDQRNSVRAGWAAERKSRMLDPEKREKVLNAHKKWRQSQKGKEYFKRPDVIKKQRLATASYQERNWEKCLDYARMRRKTVPHVKIIESIRRRINEVLKGRRRGLPVLMLVGCTKEQLIKHLESTWTEGMNWQNYGPEGWVIDHKRPLASFDNLGDVEQQKEAFHYTNYQALWRLDNSLKSDKWEKSLATAA